MRLCEENHDIDSAKERYIVKSNDLIQKGRYELTVPEQKALAYVCSLIKHEDPSKNRYGIPYQLEYEFNITTFIKICGISDGGKNYKNIMALLQNLAKKRFLIPINGRISDCSWINKSWYDINTSTLKVRLDEDLIPYLFELGKNFTKYELGNVLGMKSTYSIRIYELLKSYQFRHKVEINLDEFKEILDLNKYKMYSNFKEIRLHVLDIAMEEINKLTDIVIEYTPIYNGRKVTKIRFEITEWDGGRLGT